LKSICGGATVDSQGQADVELMRRALDLARATAGLASPNPQVGCVLVRDGSVVGEGAHLYDAYDHAEIVALRNAGERAHGATAYVTLEPCSHHGRTGPCADALIAAGVRRVVAATVDPNPRVSGQGLARLRAAGVEVTLGVLEQESRALNAAFARWVRTARPLVTLKAALSADGMLAPPASARTARSPHWITGEAARAEGQRLRHAADAVLTGIGTVLADDPRLTDRTGLARRRPLLRVVLDSRLRTPLDSRLVRTANRDVLVFCAMDAAPDRTTALRAAGVEVLPVAGVLDRPGQLDLAAVLDALGKRQILSVLLECGSALNGFFLSERLVDGAVLFYSQTELGMGAVPFAAGTESPSSLEQSLRSVTRATFGADRCVCGVLQDAWEGISRLG
jgi:diaminohydroxyphosphoribosylaminopyrimidine deaminase / 5-amino-6-(5-phosphoribosylamino)uracil reductase